MQGHKQPSVKKWATNRRRRSCAWGGRRVCAHLLTLSAKCFHSCTVSRTCRHAYLMQSCCLRSCSASTSTHRLSPPGRILCGATNPTMPTYMQPEVPTMQLRASHRLPRCMCMTHPGPDPVVPLRLGAASVQPAIWERTGAVASHNSIFRSRNAGERAQRLSPRASVGYAAGDDAQDAAPSASSSSWAPFNGKHAVVVGAGPAGCLAAMYLARDGKKVHVVTFHPRACAKSEGLQLS